MKLRSKHLILLTWLLLLPCVAAAQETASLVPEAGTPIEDGLRLARDGFFSHDGRKLCTRDIAGENALVVGLTEAEAWELQPLVRLCAMECRRWAGNAPDEPRQPRLLFQLARPDDGALVDTSNGTIVPLDGSQPAPVLAATICRAFVRRRIKAAVKERRGSHVHDIYDFLATALAARILYGGGPASLQRPDYRLLRRQYADGGAPDVRTLLEHPLPPQAPPALQRLYLMHCEILLSCLDYSTTQQRPGGLAEAWATAAAAASCPTAASALETALGLQSGSSALQLWFETMAPDVLNSARVILTGQECEEALRQLLTISVLDASATSGIRVIPLRDVPRLLPDYRLDSNTLAALQSRLTTLQQEAPPLLRDALRGFQQAVDTLVHGGGKRAFQRQYDEAWEAFRQARERDERAQALLQEVPDNSETAQRLRDWEAAHDFLKRLRAPVDAALFGRREAAP